MWLTKAIFYLLLLFIIVLFSVQNASDEITLHFFGYDTGKIPAIEALLFAFFAGLAVAGLYAIWKYFSLLKKYKEILAQNEGLKDEIGTLRKMSLEEQEPHETEGPAETD
ncbi:MAG TPA: lipopolysaccharide assembly protein LapA domain-containing protein [Candidatus Mcinerneyibacteriales bacterium]|nr:lipopolysaccharide assembly protein LapA domain-containing protein [Candidatus Mcinerneyibacteriales bacterium]